MKPKLLILDDQAQYLRSLRRALDGDFDVYLAETPDEARGKCTQSIDVALVDVRLDETNDADRQGLAFITELRDRFPDLPLVAMSALDLENQEEAISRANRFLRKPIVMSRLRGLLRELTGQKNET